jgi:hypothetical protein
MNIDFLPLPSLAIESGGVPVTGPCPTLTLQLALATRQGARDAMSGTARVGSGRAPTARIGALRAAVLPADDSRLTITF